MKETDLFIVRL